MLRPCFTPDESMNVIYFRTPTHMFLKSIPIPCEIEYHVRLALVWFGLVLEND